MKAIFQYEKYIHDSKEIQNQWLHIFLQCGKLKQVMKCHIQTHHQTKKPELERASQHLVIPNEPQESWQDRKKPNKEGKSATTPREK